MAITKAKWNYNQYSAIATSNTFFIANALNYSLNSEEMAKKLNNVYNNKLTIVVVSDEITEFNISKIGDSVLSNYTQILVPYNKFFEKELIHQTFVENNDMNHMIFMFHNLDYRKIVANLALSNIIISGGSNSKKHILSPIQLRLARFIIAMSEYTGVKVADSFHSEKTNKVKGIDFSNKEIKKRLSNLTDEDKIIVLRNNLEGTNTQE